MTNRLTDQANPRRPSRGSYQPKPETLALLKVSGNPINGVGETTRHRPSPFFWHSPDKHPWGGLQIVAREYSRKCPGSAEAFQAAYECPELMPVAETRNLSAAEDLSDELKQFALAHEADDIGIAAMDPLYVFEGYGDQIPKDESIAFAHHMATQP